jgi:hypothetical protein
LPADANGTAWKRGFLEFLCLALKCATVHGTPASSFAFEAAIFGGVPYHALSDAC